MNTLLIVWLAAHGCDTATTSIALARGGVERNPLYTQSATTTTLLMAGEAAAVTLAVKKLGPKHPTFAKAMLAIGIGVSGYAAVHNLRTIQAMR